jgi:hypothetical protein
MRYRGLVLIGALALLVAAAALAVLPNDAQTPGSTASAPASSSSTPRFTAGSFTPPPSSFVPAKTSWGDPDISGVYDFMTFLRMERPPEFASKKTLTEAELKEYFTKYAPNEDACGTGSREGETCTADQDAQVGDYNEFWDNRKWVPDNRSALIVDPDDGKRPPYLPAFQKRLDEWQAARRARGPLDSWHDFSTVTRCIAEQTPNGPQMYNSGTLIMQSPGWVMLIRERLDTRYIALDGRAHIDDKVRLWHGHSVGRWEGNTLVVDTTNFTDKQMMAGVGSTLPAGVPFGSVHLVERFVPISATQIQYYATVEAPEVWTRPWTFMLPWQKDPEYTIYEYACHEGDLSIENALRGERMLEARRAEAAKRGPRADHTSALVGRTEAEIKARLGEPVRTVNTRWIYDTASGNPLYLFFDKGVVTIAQPNDLPLADIRKR